MSEEQIMNQAPEYQPTFNSGAMIRTLTIVAMLSGFLVVLVYEYTKPLIAENQRIAVEQAIFNVIPDARSWQAFTVNGDEMTVGDSGDHTIYAGYDANGKLAGVAAEAASQGYADTIKLLYGYNPECECITGIKILKSAETPGLGDKIYKDSAFISNFDALDAKLNSDRNALENHIITVKHGTKTDPWQIDAISGATISSRAIGRALDESAQHLLPVVTRAQHKFTQGDR